MSQRLQGRTEIFACCSARTSCWSSAKEEVAEMAAPSPSMCAPPKVADLDMNRLAADIAAGGE